VPAERITYRCAECGETVDGLEVDGDLALMMAAHNLCFQCAFWAEKVAIRDRADVVRAGGQHYMIGEATPDMKPRHKGYGGERFEVRFFDGRVVETDNLWHQGTIPSHFRDRLPDNATLHSLSRREALQAER